MFVKGALVSASLIMAIGGQNAFVLKNGLKKNNVFAVSLICFLCDFLLMTIGVLGLGSILATNKWLSGGLAIFGAAFLGVYGFNSFKSSFAGNDSLLIDGQNQVSDKLKTTVLATLAVTLLNPHVYLDTVVIVGGIAGTLAFEQKLQFLAGALLASFVWFFGLGFGARFLLPLFQKPKAWRILEFVIGCIMWWIAFGLLAFAYRLFIGQ
ncbi:LysE/ArgO family amino acid transporter [Moraxella cuniculi]|uniref:Arginine exporter protein ArgO n=1 Tax=Moraxella cuniculi TaxID=34061 RepID=A0A3S4QS05_9GAMM|nr:LysE/ArgO family amino acid transporter [Moraxella cuniculi]VEG12955.1 Arginine exporter protein ArgO [Moraxella cuniculi]